ncbi:protoheme IX farnesyltransferase [Thalassotalea litorea]|uniref:Protoheme IX farnesyltransferase n=1 Tax=Thalassotalea litorea TaxID=2020715 RepID=A0A5R9IGH1_9GAMM|nr:heme o synthase [Thalassotalea litorea]TLU64634.1 protoheme IX farnesyltransferase [Thalassotalea litorea]
MSELVTETDTESVVTESMSTKAQAPLWREYYEITKPRVVALLVLTALVGMCMAMPGAIPWQIMVPSIAGIWLLSSASAAINHIVDQQIDAKMARTSHRPLPNGRITTSKAIVFTAMLSLIGFTMLYVWVNPLTAWLTLSGLVGYSVIYTMYLKRATPQNITIGGLAGAIPPLLGWTSVTNEIHPHALLLVLLVFTWTPPHFWALAIHRRDDYAKVNIPMLPVTHGINFTKTQILLYTVLLFIVGLIPYLVEMSNWLYLIGAVTLNLIFLAYAWKLKFNAEKDTAMQTFRFSIIHLMVLFVVLLADHYLLPINP